MIPIVQTDVLFLCETIANANKPEELKYVLDFDCCFTVDRQIEVAVSLFIGSLL